MHWTRDVYPNVSGGAVCGNANVLSCQVSCYWHFLGIFLPENVRVQQENVWRTCNGKKNKKNTNFLWWKTGAIHVEETQTKMSAWTDNEIRKLLVIRADLISRIYMSCPASCMINPEATPECPGHLPVIASCCFLHMLNENCLDPILQTFSRVHDWKQLYCNWTTSWKGRT